jgi:uncharacterized protein YkwD
MTGRPTLARRAAAALLLALAPAALAAPASAQNDDGNLTAIEQSALDGVNAERRAAGLEPLVCTPELCRMARSFSRDMAERHFFDHQDPDGRRVDARADQAGIHWRSVGENIARNRGFKDPAAVAVREWMKSSGHRQNILDARYLETGVGAWVAPDKTVYFTQVFVLRSPK